MTSSTLAKERIRSAVGWSLVAEALKLVASTGVFLLVARRLGVDEYGVYAASFALVATLGPFANLGSGHVLIRAIARGEEPERALGEALTRTLAGGICGAVLCLVLHFVYLTSAPVLVLLLLGVAELVGTATTDLCAQYFYASGDARTATRIRLVAACARLVAGGLLVVSPGSGYSLLLKWCGLYLVAMIAAALAALMVVRRSSRVAARPVGVRWRAMFVGLPFSMNLSAAYVQDDIDKTLMLRYAGTEATGFYAAGYRIINLAYVPLQAALNVIYPKFFGAASTGTDAAWRFLRRLLLPAMAYGVVAGGGLFLVAQVLPWILGDEYRSSATVVMALAWLPALRALDYAFADFLTCTGRQGHRVVMQAVGAVANVLLNIWLIPNVGWEGAVIAAIVSESLTLLLLAITGVALRRKDIEHAA